MKNAIILSILLISAFTAFSVMAGVTGKISGSIKDVDTGEPLIGVNVQVEGTNMGAATDLQGYFVILNVPPGTYKLKTTMIGYSAYIVSQVRVNIDLTTELDIKMKPEVLLGEEVQIVAERPIIQKDVAASTKNITSEHIEALPISSVTEAVGLQAGVTSALSIRGSGADQALFMVDGIILRDERNNKPITAVPLSAVQDISVQTGGFSAEYNNVRSGVVNVVTKEGDPNQYTGTITYKVRPPAPKYFGTSPYDPSSFWLRPYIDEAVCWEGTKNGVWDPYLQRQYPVFEGWNAVSARTMSDDDPTNDLTPAAARRIFMWEHRKEGDIDKSDYNVDGGFGGPVPLIGKYLGNLRFYASFRKVRDMYLMELSRDALTNQSTMLRVASDINPSMKLSLMGLYGETFGTALSRSGGTEVFEYDYEIADAIDRAGFTVPWRIYTNTYWSSTARYYNTLSAKLTHVLNPTTFYEAQVKHTRYKYFTMPGRNRDYSKTYQIYPGYVVGEAPFGFQSLAEFGITGLAFGGPISTARDYSRISNTTVDLDIVSQVNRTNQIKSGISIVYDDFNMSFGSINTFLPEGNTWSRFSRNPYRFTAYITDKMEYKGFYATLGVIADYSNPNGEWWDVGVYNKAFYSQNYVPDSDIPTKKAETKLEFSPRLAISHPITENSKLYFNYGHYRQMPTSERQYRVQRAGTGSVDYLGDPTLPLARTVSYELGYDHNLFENFLFHLSAYYKDISDQEDWTRYISIDGKVNYYQLTANSYEDIRGFEADLTRLWGRWIMGNINYEYRVETSGYFGYGQYNENPADQREYVRQNPKQTRPRPRPRFKSYLDFHTPSDLGASYWGIKPLAEWHANLLTRWTAGSWFTWNPNQIPTIEYNVQWKGSWAIDLKLSKTIPIGNLEIKLFADIYNLLNLKEFSQNSFYDVHDYNAYMTSLHYEAKIGDKLGYGYIAGEDKPGDVRKDGAEFVPMEWTASRDNVSNPSTRAIYYEASTKKYMQFSNEQWVEVSQSRLDQVKKDKAYIDMPNQTFFTFLNPRTAFYGITINYRF